MVNVNVILPIVLLIFFFMSFPLLLQMIVRRRTQGHHLCAILEKDKPLTIRLLKKRRDDFVKDGKDE